VCACATVAAALLGAAGCGAGQRQDANDRHGTYTVDLERVQFPASQRIAQRSTFVITVRNAGDATIPNLAVTLHGFTKRTGNSRDANPSASLWIIDAPPAGTQTAIEDPGPPEHCRRVSEPRCAGASRRSSPARTR